jgi:nucleotide-binding universal stress UspA family protein
MKLLVAIDGSKQSERVVTHLVTHARSYIGSDGELHLLNVQPPLTRNAGKFVHADTVKQFHRDKGVKALESARTPLRHAGIAHEVHIDVGNPAEVIDRYARELATDIIVMGTRDLGKLGDLVLGSTSERVLRLTTLPVLIVK